MTAWLVYRQQQHVVGIAECAPELVEQGVRSIGGVRLKHDPHVAVSRRTRRAQHRRDLGGMVRIVVDDPDAVTFAAQLEAAACTGELGQCRRGLGHIDSGKRVQAGDRRRGVEGVVGAGQRQRHVQRRALRRAQPEPGAAGGLLDAADLPLDVAVAEPLRRCLGGTTS